MTGIANKLRSAFPVLALLGLAGGSARADIILEQYEFQGAAGSQTTQVPSFVASTLGGVNFGEANVTPSAGVNSINSSGWNAANANYSFGLTVGANESVTVDQLILTSRSSGTGPGFVSVLASVDGGAFKSVATITQTGTNYNDEFLAITPVTALKSLTFEIVVTPGTLNSDANGNVTGGTNAPVASTGTFRVGDYNPSGTATPFTINGTINPLTPPAVPEPASIAMTGLGGLCLAAFAAIRKARRAR